MEVLSLERIRELLQDRKLDVVSKATNLSYATLRNVKLGEGGCHSSTIEALSDYFNNN